MSVWAEGGWVSSLSHMKLVPSSREIGSNCWIYELGSRRKILFAAGTVLAVTLNMLIWSEVYPTWMSANVYGALHFSHTAAVWPAQGRYSFTVVTAMLDIGRGSWPSTQSRSYNTYLREFKQLLKMDVNLATYVDRKTQRFVHEQRKEMGNKTTTILVGMEDLPYFRYRGRIAEIMNSSEYKRDNELVALRLCRSYIPEYDILQLSKLYFLHRTILTNPFNTTYFVWMDGGYGHGHDIYPSDGSWIPKELLENPGRITFIERPPGVLHYEKVKDTMHKLLKTPLVGGFFGGGVEAFKELYEMQQQQVDEWMRDGVVDDDQTMYMLLYYKKPSLFHLVPGDWYDAFRLFNKNGTV